MSNRANLANGLTASALDATTNTLRLQPGYAVSMPPVPFYLTITPFGQLPTMGNSEIVQVTAVSGDNLNIVRAQKGTVRKAFPANSVVSNSVYADDKIGADNIDFTTMPIAGLITTKTNNDVNDKKPLAVQCGRARVVVPRDAIEATIDVQFPERFNSGAIPVVVCTYNGYGNASDEWSDTPNSSWAGAAFGAVAVTNSGFTARCRRFDGAMLIGVYYFSWIAVGQPKAI